MTPRILIVDDHDLLRDCLASAFASIPGAQVLQAGDGVEALELLAGSGVDLVVTDVQMPRMKGDELVRELRRRGTFVPVFLMSADSRLTPEHVTELGATAFFDKTHQLPSLLNAVGDYFTAAKAAAPGQA